MLHTGTLSPVKNLGYIQDKPPLGAIPFNYYNLVIVNILNVFTVQYQIITLNDYNIIL